MPDLTWEEMQKELGLSDKASVATLPKPTKELSWSELQKEVGAASDEENTDSFITSIVKNALAETSVGVAARASGAVDYEPKDLGAVGNIASGIGGFVLDPATYLTGGLGNIIGKSAAKKLVTYAAKKGLIGAAARAAPSTISAATQLGGLEAVREAAGGEFHPGEIAKATVSGAVLGPAGMVKNPIGRAAAEVGAMTATPIVTELRAPTADDLVHAAGTVGGFRLVKVVENVLKRLKPGQDPKAALEAEIGPEETKKIVDWAEVEVGTVPKGKETPLETVPPATPLIGEVVPATPAETAAVVKDTPGAVAITPQVEALAALAGKPTVSRKEYAEATGIKIGHVPVAAQRKADAEAAKVAVEESRNAQEKVSTETESQAPPEAEAEVPEGVLLGDEGRPVGIRNAITDQERELRGFPERVPPETRSLESVKAEARQIIEENPDAQGELIDRLRERPAPHTNVEVGLLTYKQKELQEAHDRAIEAEKAAKEGGDEAAILEATANKKAAADELLDLYEVNVSSGTETARGLQARNMIVNADFSYEKMVERRKAAEGVEELSPESKKAVEEEYVAIRDAERQEASASEAAEAKEVATAVDSTISEIDKSVTKERSQRSAQAKAEVDAAWKDFEKKATGKLFSNPLDPELIASGVQLAKAYIRLGVVNFKDFLARIGKRVGAEKAKKAEEHLESAWRVAIQQETPKPKKPISNVEDASSFVKTLSKFFVSIGVKERKQLVRAVHGELEKAIPGITRLETMHAISRYGKFRPLSKDDVDVTRRELEGQLLQVSKLLSMRAGEAPAATGFEMPVKGDEQRRLVQRVNEAKKKGGYAITDPAKQLQSSLGAIKTRLKNQIADLVRQIETRRKTNKKSGKIELDSEAKKLVAERDALREQYDEIFGKPELTDTQRLEIATKATERAITEAERRIVENDIAPKEPKQVTSPELEARREYLDALKEELKHMRDLADPKKTPEERSDSAYTAGLKRQKAELKRRLEQGDYEPKVRQERKLTEEQEALKFQTLNLKFQAMKELAKIRQANRTLPQKALFGAKEVLNTSRAILTSMDLSAVLRQGGFIVFGHPVRGFKALGSMFNALRSKEALFREEQKLARRENAPWYKKAGLALTDVFGRLTQQEEAYMSTWAKKIPVVAGLERAYVAFLNRLRADSFDAMAKTLGKNGKVGLAEAKVIANFINVATGRGDLGRFNAAAEALATVFFAPKYVTSRFQLLGLQPLWRGTAETRKLIATEYARTLAGLGVFYGLSSAALTSFLGEPDKKTWGIELDRRSSDFGKIRIGNTRIDPLFGLQQAAVLISRLQTGETKTLRGKVVPIRGDKVPFGGSDAVDVGTRFLRTKLSPVVGAAASLLSGENVVGEPVTAGSIASELALPIGLRDIYDAMREQGVPAGSALGLMSILGIGVQTYDEKRKKNKAA